MFKEYFNLNKIKNSEFESKLVTFKLGEEEFGVDIMYVQEVITIPEITKIPQAPFFIEGISNLRGNILPILDLRLKFGMEPIKRTESSRVIVIDMNGKIIGLTVDKVCEVLRVENDLIEPAPPLIIGMNSISLGGIVKLDQGEHLILLLDLYEILKIQESIEKKESINNTQSSISRFEEKREKIEEEHLVSFFLGREEYAIEITQIQEILRIPPIIKIPQCEYFVEGIINIRNNVVPLIDLRRKMEIDSVSELTESSRVLVINFNDIKIGLIIDSVSEVLRIPKETIEPAPPIITGIDREYISGVGKLKGGERLIILLDIKKLFSIEETEIIKNLNKSKEKNIDDEHIIKEKIQEEELVTFKIENEEFCIKIMQVQEIVSMSEITKIPKAPIYVEGVVNLRGNILPVINLKKLFQIESQKEFTSTNRIIVIDIYEKKIGIIVDSVSEVLRIPKNNITPAPPIVSGIETDFLDSVCNLNNGERMLMILDISKLFKDLNLDNKLKIDEQLFHKSLPEVNILTEHLIETPKIQDQPVLQNISISPVTEDTQPITTPTPIEESENNNQKDGKQLNFFSDKEIIEDSLSDCSNDSIITEKELKIIIKKSGLKDKDFSEKIGIEKNLLSKLKKGIIPISKELSDRIKNFCIENIENN